LKLVAIETSGRIGSVAAWDGARVVTERVFEKGMQHGRELVPKLNDIVEDAGWTPDRIDVVAVSVGPGSYTGLRVGVTCAKTLAYATGAKIVAVPTLDVLARNVPAGSESICPVVDAKRKQVYGCVYDARYRRLTDFLVLRPGELLGKLPRPVVLLGDGLETYSEVFTAEGITIAPKASWRARASVVAELGGAMHIRGEHTDLHSLTPLYLRRPEAEEMWERKHRSD